MPRIQIRKRVTPRLIQSVQRLLQHGADRMLSRANFQVEQQIFKDGEPVYSSARAAPDNHGGWVIDNLKMNNALIAALARACHVEARSVDYRLVRYFRSRRQCKIAWRLRDGCLPANTTTLMASMAFRSSTSATRPAHT
jgi:hypothetical protein